MNIQSILLGMINAPQIIFVVVIFIPLVVLPFIISLIDIIRYEFEGNGKVLWLLVILFFPFFGSIIYLIAGRKQRIKKN